MFLTIGSTAIKHWFPDFGREPRDFDYVSRVPLMPIGGIERKDYHPIEPLYQFLNDTDEFLDANSLFTLKLSHLMYDFKWEKNFNDCIFLSSKGCEPNYELLEELKKYWNTQKTHKNKRLETLFGEGLRESNDITDALRVTRLVIADGYVPISKIDGVTFMRGLKFYSRHVETKGQFFIIQNYRQILNQYKSIKQKNEKINI